jgi:hypothetical protein
MSAIISRVELDLTPVNLLPVTSSLRQASISPPQQRRAAALHSPPAAAPPASLRALCLLYPEPSHRLWFIFYLTATVALPSHGPTIHGPDFEIHRVASSAFAVLPGSPPPCCSAPL